MDSLPLEVIQRIPRFLPPKTFYAIIPLVSRGLLEATFNCIPGCRDRKLGINCTLRVMDRKRDSLAVGRSPGMEFTLVKNRRGTTWTGVNVDLHLGFRGVGRMIVGDHETLESLFLTRIRRSRTWLSNRRLKVVVSTVVFNGNVSAGSYFADWQSPFAIPLGAQVVLWELAHLASAHGADLQLKDDPFLSTTSNTLATIPFETSFPNISSLTLLRNGRKNWLRNLEGLTTLLIRLPDVEKFFSSLDYPPMFPLECLEHLLPLDRRRKIKVWHINSVDEPFRAIDTLRVFPNVSKLGNIGLRFGGPNQKPAYPRPPNLKELLKESQLQELDLALSYNRVVFQDFDSSEGENADARFKNMLELAGTIVGEPERLKTVNIFLSIWFEESDLYHAVRRRVWEEIWSDFKDTLDTMFKARSGFKGNCRFIFQDTRLDSYGLSKKKLSELLGEVVDLAARAGVTFISELQI